MTPQVTVDSVGGHLRELASAAAAGLGGTVVARVLGPEMRGEYAAVTVWFGVAIMVWRLRLLTLAAALIVLALTMLAQLGWAYCRCRSAGLAPGRASGARRDYALDLRMAFILEKLI